MNEMIAAIESARVMVAETATEIESGEIAAELEERAMEIKN